MFKTFHVYAGVGIQLILPKTQVLNKILASTVSHLFRGLMVEMTGSVAVKWFRDRGKLASNI